MIGQRKASSLQCWTVVVILAVSFSAIGARGGKKSVRSGQGVVAGSSGRDQHDALRLARCDAKCWSQKKPERVECISMCLSTQKKPGLCAAPREMSAWDAACVRACTTDAKCPGVFKCCRHKCGATCQLPRGLHDAPGLPKVPANLTIWEPRRGRAVRVCWSSPDEFSYSETTPILFVVEERHHVGRHFAEERLGDWTPRQRSKRSNISLKNVVKPGRWYQFRVAAVNENGTRGFSMPSAPFTASHGPRPPGPPLTLAVDGLRHHNGSLRGTLSWRPPLSSDLPVHKYKVFWSRRLQGVDQELDSVLVNHHTVGKDQTMFELKGLQPKSLYFLQVQALAQFGTTRLKSEKSAIVLNTTNYSNDSAIPSEGNSSKRSAEDRIEGLHFQKFTWNKDQLLARVAWKPIPGRPGKPVRYSVEWWTGPCKGEDKDHKTRKQIVVTTNEPKLHLYDLHFSCKYFVHVNKISTEGRKSREAVIRFNTPSCEEFQMMSKKEIIKCN